MNTRPDVKTAGLVTGGDRIEISPETPLRKIKRSLKRPISQRRGHPVRQGK